MLPHWVKQHQPVISVPGKDHHLYAIQHVTQPNGEIVLCHGRCNQGLVHHIGASMVRFECLGCNSRCSVPLPVLDRTSPLGRCGLIKTPYPPKQCPGNWRSLTNNESEDPTPTPSADPTSSHGPSQSRPNKRPSQDLRQTAGQKRAKKKAKKAKKQEKQERV